MLKNKFISKKRIEKKLQKEINKWIDDTLKSDNVWDWILLLWAIELSQKDGKNEENC